MILHSRLRSRSEEPLQGSLEGLAAQQNLVLNGSTPQELLELTTGSKVTTMFVLEEVFLSAARKNLEEKKTSTRLDEAASDFFPLLYFLIL